MAPSDPIAVPVVTPLPGSPAGPLTVEDVWRDFAGPLHGFVHRRVADRHAVDDIVADVLLRIHTHLDALDDHEKVTAWIYRIARNAIVDHHRRTARRGVPSDIDEHQLPAGADADGWVDDQGVLLRELAGLLRPLVARLPEEHRRAIELTDLGGMTQVEAARLEQVSVSGMKSRVQRGRRQLVSLLHQRCEITLDASGLPTECTPRDAGCGCDFPRDP